MRASTPPTTPVEQAYRAQPFPHDPPPEAVPGPLEARPPQPRTPRTPRAGDDAPDDGYAGVAYGDETYEDAYADGAHHDDEGGGARPSRRSRRTRGRRARRGRGKRIFVLAACLGMVLLGMTVTEIGTPVLPWSEQSVSGPDTQAVGEAEAATKTPDDKRSGSPSDTPSSAASDVPGSEASASASTSPSEKSSPTQSSKPSPEPTEITGTVAPDPEDPEPTDPPQESSDPTPPDHDDQDPPDDDYDDCWLLFCS